MNKVLKIDFALTRTLFERFFMIDSILGKDEKERERGLQKAKGKITLKKMKMF